MKKIIKFSLLAVFLTASAFVNPLKAQDVSKELNAFVKKFERAYNNKNHKALQEMYSKDASRTGTDGKVVSGNEAIAAQFAEQFKGEVTIVLKNDKVETSPDGITTITGSYHVTGSSEKGEKIDRKGIYVNTVVKENGQWKITKSILTAS